MRFRLILCNSSLLTLAAHVWDLPETAKLASDIILKAAEPLYRALSVDPPPSIINAQQLLASTDTTPAINNDPALLAFELSADKIAQLFNTSLTAAMEPVMRIVQLHHAEEHLDEIRSHYKPFPSLEL